MPPTGGERGSVNLLAGGVASLHPAKRQYDRRGLGFRAKDPERMLQILLEYENQQSGNAQVAEGPPFESAASGRRPCRFSFERLPETGYLGSRFRQRSFMPAKWRRWRPRRNGHFVLNLLSLPIAHVLARFSCRPKARGRSPKLSVGTGRVYSVETRAGLLPSSTVLTVLIYNTLQVGERDTPIDCQAKAAGACRVRRAPAARDAARRTVTCHWFLGSLSKGHGRFRKIAGLFCARIVRDRIS